MKNNFKIFSNLIIILNLLISFSSSEEIKFEANSIELFEKDERIIAKNNVKIFNEDETIYADEMDYNKANETIKALGNIKVESNKNKLRIYSEKLDYSKKSEKIIFHKDVKINLENKFSLSTDEAIYNKFDNEIIIKKDLNFKDNFGNAIFSKGLKFLVNEKILKLNSVEMIDELKNKYYFENTIVNFETNELIGDGIKIDFFKNSFGNIENDPRLRGNYLYSSNNTSLIKKGVFTTCKKNKENCPPWQFKAQEIKHDKNKKTIYYKNAWLEIYEKPVVYFPRFFHPDPTVKRQSGFLMPKFESSSSLGDSLSIPYFKVISDSKDITFTPKIFSENEGLFQNEYRQENKNSSHITDLSLKKSKKNSKSHFFSNTIANLNLSFFENSELEMNIETTSNDNYLKSHKIKSAITNNNSLLNSFLLMKGSKENLYLEAKVEA
ncbi:MAG: hypothetical protein CMM98_02555, partial [Rickettsiales bacterium]|nr:hypothetical protein [Rickettsiales bacterium]